jgi:hypothetical protein
VLIEHDDEPPIVDEIVCLERAALTSDTRGLTLAEAKTVYRHLHQVAQRLEGELGDEQPFFVEG